MAQAQTNRLQVLYSAESAWAETPSSPTMSILRVTAARPRHVKGTALSDVITSTRLRQYLAEISQDGACELDFELAYTEFETLLAAMLASAFVTTTKTAITISADTSDDSFNDSGNGFVTAGFVAGQWIRVSGFTETANNGVFRINAVTAGKITLLGSANLTTEIAGDSVTIKGKYLRNGVLEPSFLLEIGALDIGQYLSIRGATLNTMRLNFPMRNKVTGTMTFVGQKAILDSSSLDAAPTAASVRNFLSTSTNIGHLWEGGAALATGIMGLTIEMNNNVRAVGAVNSKPPIGVGFGWFEASGTLDAYFEDATLLNKFLNHTATELSLRLTDPDATGDIIFTAPQVYYGGADGGTPQYPAGNQEVPLNLPWVAPQDPTYLTAMQVDVLAA